ncbi:head morphogenesis [Gordonia phage Love]|uniref:MuF-like minor capsid protein n=3 Tax=Vividuovirus TaxID=2560251 RepID=A0A7G8LDU6_9CAUD|nr:head morphogenesis [Gordonia phage Galadriel]YP_010109469.1 head morphogenesis [Gordonia phage Paries]YP_010109851.1 head morphogenesis [Gordonia phage Love]QDH92035.1 MuF-like minor capsid protein [Gordonia phage Galadriel]QNJ55418.1 MuF-like minor capsid protein [Gordonia phage Paries]QNJ57736.1 minor capsid protein [Gordonia phage Love]
MAGVTRRRAEHQQLLRRAERGIDAAVLAAMDVWLTAVRFALVDELVPRRIVADAEYAVDAAVQRTWGVWQNQLENQVLPTVSVAFGDAFQQVRRADPQGAFAHQQQYLAEVSDRLRIWPAGAFEDIRPELLESLSDAVTIDEMTERVGRVLNIDAKSRKLRAQINDVEAQLADPDLDPADRPALTQWRRDLWEQHDESLNEWQWKARRIARTESHGAVSAGQLAAARVVEQQTGLRMWKRWLSTEDQRTRASHRVADGQTCPLDEPFRVGGFLLEHPADSISVAPHEVVNCRCTMLVYDDNELQDEFDDQGGKGPVEPGAVRIGPDDPDAADAAILQVAEREKRATPQVGQRGEDYGQQLPAQPLDVELTDERTPIPVPDLETASDQRLADYLIRTDERDGDPTLRDEVDAELSRRREAEAFEVQFGQPEYADDVIEVDDDDAWLDDPRFRDPGDDGTYESTDVEPDPDYDPDLSFDEWAAEPDESRLPDDAVPADPPLIPEPLDFDEGDEDWVALNDEWEWVRGALHETIAEGSTDYDLQELIEYVATLESARADLIAKAATVPDVDPIAAERAEYVELWGEAAAVAEFDPLHAPREETSEDRRRRALMEQADQLAEDRGISYEQALAEIQGLDPDQVRRREFVAEGKRQGLVSTSYASMLDELHNNLSFDWLLMCEDATNGQTLKPRSRDLGQFAADMLWKVNDNTARKHMSDEAALWFDQNGRITKADLGAMIEDGRWAFDAQAVLDLYATWPGRRLGGDYLA